jgi:TRAP-type C4-dicarboxylate transport system permease small subunit
MMERAVNAFGTICAALAALLLAALFLLGLSDLMLRNTGFGSLSFATEYSGYLMASIMLLGLGQALRDDKHIRIAMVLDKLPANLRRTLDLSATLIGLGVAALLTFALAHYAAGSFTSGAKSYFASATPLWLPQALLVLGPLSLTLALLQRLLAVLKTGHA